MKGFEHYNAESIQAACNMLKAGGGRMKPIAGGTDLITALKADIIPTYPEAVLNLKTIPGLDGICERDDALHIGAMAKLADIAANDAIKRRYPALSASADSVASPQIRNIGTIGGNICQDTRCWYYRYPNKLGGGAILCPRKGGKGACPAIKGDNRYHAIMGGRRCFGVCPSDTAVALAALDARLAIAGAGTERSIAVKDFYSPLGNALMDDELVVGIEIPAINAACGQSFVKFAARASIDFAIVSAAAVLTIHEGRCCGARLAMGAVAPGPLRPLAAETSLIGKAIDETSAAQAAELAIEGATPLSMNGYKIDIAKAMLKRAILEAVPAGTV